MAGSSPHAAADPAAAPPPPSSSSSSNHRDNATGRPPLAGPSAGHARESRSPPPPPASVPMTTPPPASMTTPPPASFGKAASVSGADTAALASALGTQTSPSPSFGAYQPSPAALQDLKQSIAMRRSSRSNPAAAGHPVAPGHPSPLSVAGTLSAPPPPPSSTSGAHGVATMGSHPLLDGGIGGGPIRASVSATSLGAGAGGATGLADAMALRHGSAAGASTHANRSKRSLGLGSRTESMHTVVSNTNWAAEEAEARVGTGGDGAAKKSYLKQYGLDGAQNLLVYTRAVPVPSRWSELRTTRFQVRLLQLALMIGLFGTLAGGTFGTTYSSALLGVSGANFMFMTAIVGIVTVLSGLFVYLNPVLLKVPPHRHRRFSRIELALDLAIAALFAAAATAMLSRGAARCPESWFTRAQDAVCAPWRACWILGYVTTVALGVTIGMAAYDLLGHTAHGAKRARRVVPGRGRGRRHGDSDYLEGRKPGVNRDMAAWAHGAWRSAPSAGAAAKAS
ncbi:hypothetical protein CXG81DRAFT_19277 [Caulochytrium protostelioides]|uniref:MARVEL domain-containing protein n=1 Tax=Caulochytrium protostelioides TaxID=1555241 RepID=A0A4P9X6L2_9FUNG|nr:hypothetical protein CXG81DRAFT_19277 [Caulochytrium protostelioides]|eukprot:RKP00837.1 hypothetical protein CXG81DRAFT_19277 [Caulochytrium protostelioides]